MTNKMKDLKSQIDSLKEQFIQEIINDDYLSKLEKLKLFYEENLFHVASSIKDEYIFENWIEELENKINNKTGRRTIVDTFLDSFERHEIFLFHEVDRLLENYIYRDSEEGVYDCPDVIPVLKCRTSGLTLEKTSKEIIDRLYDYAIKNRICGYTIDW